MNGLSLTPEGQIFDVEKIWLSKSTSRIVVAESEESLLVALSSGGYSIVPRFLRPRANLGDFSSPSHWLSRDFFEAFAILMPHYTGEQLLYEVVRWVGTESSEFCHDLSEVPLSYFTWRKPEYEVLLKGIDTGQVWYDQWNSPHPVIVNAYDVLVGEKPTYKVGAAVFEEVPHRESVEARWDCKIPINRVSM